MDEPTQPRGDGDATEWLMPSASAEERGYGEVDKPRRRAAFPVALVAVGALAGAVVVSLLHGGVSGQSSATPPPAAAAVNGSGVPDGQRAAGSAPADGPGDGATDRDGVRDGPGPPGGGPTGARRVAGTLSAVGSSSITVNTTRGTVTYAVNGTTQIVRDATPATLRELRVGDPVVVHAEPSGNASVVERVFAATLPGNPGFSRDGAWDGRSTASST